VAPEDIRLIDVVTSECLEPALLACNPDLPATLRIEDCKNHCIRTVLCAKDAEDFWEFGPEGPECSFRAWDIVRECGEMDPSLRDFKIVVRHLEAEAATGHLEKRRDERGKVEYVFR